MSLENVSLILNIILACISVYLFFKNKKTGRWGAEKNYNNIRLEIGNLFVKNMEDYKKKAVELGAWLDNSGEIEDRSFRSMPYSVRQELKNFADQKEAELNIKRNELRYWAKIGNINLFTNRPHFFGEKLYKTMIYKARNFRRNLGL